MGLWLWAELEPAGKELKVLTVAFSKHGLGLWLWAELEPAGKELVKGTNRNLLETRLWALALGGARTGREGVKGTNHSLLKTRLGTLALGGAVLVTIRFCMV